MRNEFSTFDIVKALRIPRERLREWMNRDFIKPTRSADGQGTRAVFTRQDVYGIELFRQFIERGLARDQARIFVNIYHKEMQKNNERNTRLIIRQGKLKPERKFGPDKYEAIFFAGDDEVLLLDVGSTDTCKEVCDGEWLFIQLINLKILHEETDQALGKL